MRIAVVTGGTGFVGGRICSALVEAGWTVRAMVRAGRRAPDGCAEVPWSDFRDGVALERACEGANVLLHAAGLAHVFHAAPGQRDSMTVASRGAALIAASAAQSQGVSTFVLISSIAAAVGHDDYAIGKREVEKCTAATLGDASARLAILRPPMIYGEGMRGRPLRLFEMIARGGIIPLGGVANQRSVAYVGNVADAALRICTDPGNAPAVAYPADSVPLSSEELVRRMANALGVRPRVIRIPSWILAAAGSVGTLSRGMLSPISREDVLRATGTLLVNTMPDYAPYGVPRFTTDAGLARAAAWFRNQQ